MTTNLQPFPDPEGIRMGWTSSLLGWFRKLIADLKAVLDGLSENIVIALARKFNVSDTSGTAAWDDVVFNFSTSRDTGAGVPALVDINSTGRWAHAFTNEAVANNEKRLPASVQVSHGVKYNSELRLHVHFITGARVPSVDEYVRLEFVFGVTPYGAVLSTTPYTADCLIPANTPAYTHWIGAIATISNSLVDRSADMGGTLRRKSSVASDTYEDTIYVTFGDPHVQFDRRGTAGEYS